jgi:transketolase
MAKATREAYGEELAKLVTENPKIVVMDADLAGSTKSAEAKKAAPERFFDFGIAEADMIGNAAGFAASGYTVFCSTFAMFATGRCWEQIRNSLVYPQLDVKIFGSHGGIAVGEDGVSHQAIEDLGIMRTIPKMQVYNPCDAAEMKAVVDYVAGNGRPCYIRGTRSKVEDVYPEGNVPDVTKVHVLKKGANVAIFATGLMVQAALQARNQLLEEGINPTVVDVCCLKPADEEKIGEILKDHRVIITCEEHNVVNGLGSLIADVASRTTPRLIARVGMQDRFAESGSFEALLKKYHLDADGIVETVHNAMQGDACGIHGC